MNHLFDVALTDSALESELQNSRITGPRKLTQHHFILLKQYSQLRLIFIKNLFVSFDLRTLTDQRNMNSLQSKYQGMDT